MDFNTLAQQLLLEYKIFEAPKKKFDKAHKKFNTKKPKKKKPPTESSNKRNENVTKIINHKLLTPPHYNK